MNIFGIISWIFIGIFIALCFLYPSLKKREKEDLQIKQLNLEACAESERLLRQNNDLKILNTNLTLTNEKLTAEQDRLTDKITNLEEKANLYYEQRKNQVSEQIQTYYDKETLKMTINLDQQKQNFEKQKNRYIEQMQDMESIIKDSLSYMNAAINSNIRHYEIIHHNDFYHLNLSEQDLKEIKKLKEIAKTLRDPEPLYKVLYKVYYEKPYTDLVGRVVGSTIKTGIYKITNLNNGMCYVGQAVNIADRWKQHIKRGVGAETPTKNKLYPAMMIEGVENFSFEIIEECPRAKLNEREQNWQNYFKAKEFGYSIK